MHKLNMYMIMIHSRSYSFLFTLTIAFIAIFDYKFNIQNFTFFIYHNDNQCARTTMKRFSTTAYLQNQTSIPKSCKSSP